MDQQLVSVVLNADSQMLLLPFVGVNSLQADQVCEVDISFIV